MPRIAGGRLTAWKQIHEIGLKACNGKVYNDKPAAEKTLDLLPVYWTRGYSKSLLSSVDHKIGRRKARRKVCAWPSQGKINKCGK